MLKSIVKNTENEIKSKPYPKLMIDDYGNIVLFEKDGCGTAIASPHNHYSLGTYSNELFHGEWKGIWNDYKGSVTLEQD